MMTLQTLSLALLIFAASYIQTVTGFALGLIAMGAVALFGLAPLDFAAVVVSFAIFVNTVATLRHEHHHIDGAMTLWVTAGLVPGLPLGIWLLHLLGETSVSVLGTILGMVILGSGILLMLRPHPRQTRSGTPVSVAIGILSGTLAGLFSTGGPPLAYHFYRQPLRLPTVRTSLLAVLLVSTVGRLVYVAIHGDLTGDMVQVSLLAAPMVVAGTVVGRRFRPPLSDLVMRRLAFALLTAMGALLLAGSR